MNSNEAVVEDLPSYQAAARKEDVPADKAVGARKAAFIGADIKEGLLGLDPRTHLFALLIVGAAAVLVTGLPGITLLQVAAALYLAGNGRARLAVRSCASFAVVCALSFLPLPGLYGVLLVSMLHMIGPFTIGCALFTLSPSAIMCALSRWHLPYRALVGVCMVFRFGSLVPVEARAIAQGIRMRGVFPRAFDVVAHPGLAYECFYTPLVMRCLRLSIELAASSELRGVEADGRRTSVYHVGFGLRDAAIILVVAVACGSVYAAGVVWL